MQKKTTSQTEVHTTEISQSRHDREAGHACGMTKKKASCNKFRAI